MGERETKVFYKSRILDEDEPRPRIPTALDPYDNPYAAQSPRRRNYDARGSSSTLDDDGSTTQGARSVVRSSYSTRDNDRYRDVDSRRSTRTQAPPSESAPRRSVVVDQRRDDPAPPHRLESVAGSRYERDRASPIIDYDRSRDRGREYVIDDRPRPAGSPYMIETRGEVIDISVPGRERDRAHDRDVNRYRYNDTRSLRKSVHDRDSYVQTDQSPRNGNTIVIGKENSPRPRRSDYDDFRSQRTTTREYDYDREDDWRLVDSMRDTRIESTRPPSAYTERQGRSRAGTQTSDDSYVVISPAQSRPYEASRSREQSRARSAVARRDYSESEVGRRRSRSISFRDSEVERHDCTERKHERPGAEAEICGRYLGRAVSVSDYDGRSDAYSSYHDTGRSRAGGSDRYAASYRERDEPYAPQMGYEPRKRERSRRRKRDDETDNGSYYSENITKTTRETRYR